MDEIRVNLKEEFSHERKTKMLDKELAGMVAEENRKLAESFIENNVIPALRELRKWHSMANLFCITFYVREKLDSYHVVYNTNTSAGFTNYDPTFEVSKRTLCVAAEIASSYGIESVQFIEDTHDAFRFKILI